MQIHKTLYCHSCGVEITWSPFIRRATGPLTQSIFCCQDCAENRPCHCGERMEENDEQRGKSGRETVKLDGAAKALSAGLQSSES